MKKRLKKAYGNWVEGDRFWDRESDTALLIEKLDEGALFSWWPGGVWARQAS